MAGTRTRRKTPPRNAAITAPDQTTELPKVPVDVDLLAHWTDTERAITARRAEADLSVGARISEMHHALTGMCNYALTAIAHERPGIMTRYYAIKTGQPVFTPPAYAGPADATVPLYELPAPPPVVPPVEAPYVEAELLPHPDEERIARSLTVAQQAADKYVADAQEHADEIVAAAEAEAQARAAGMAPSFEHDEAMRTAKGFFDPEDGDRR